MTTPHTPPVGRTTLRLVPIAIACRGAAFLIPVAIALWFGVGPVTDAWYWALAFPTFALVLAGSAVATTATPALARIRTQDPGRVPTVLGGLIVWTGLGGLGMGLIVCLSAPLLLEMFTAFDAKTASLTSTFLWELLPFVVLTTMGAVLRSGCEVHGKFTGVAITPVIRAVTVIAVTWVLLRPIGSHALPWGLVAGEVVQVLWWAGLLAASGVEIHPTRTLEPEIKAMGRDLMPILGGEVLVAMNLVVDKGFAGTLTSGSVATLEFADRARVIPQTLLESTLVMVGYSIWSNLMAQGKTDEAHRGMDQALRWTLAVSAPILAGMFIGREVLVGLLFERGAFGHEDTLMTSAVLAWYIPGILPNLLGILAVRAHIVERNLRLVLTLGVASVMVNFSLNSMLVGPLGIEGLALATTLNTALIAGIYLTCLVPVLPNAMMKRWTPASIIALLAFGVALVVELGPGAPSALTDSTLWFAALPCCALVGVAMWNIGNDRRSTP